MKSNIKKIASRYGVGYLFICGFDFASTPVVENLRKEPNTISQLYNHFHPDRKYSHNPFSRRTVHATEINRITGHPDPADKLCIGTVRDGNWDLEGYYNNTDYPELYRGETVLDTLLYKGLKNRFVNDYSWQETEFIQEILRIIEHGEPVWHDCSNRQEVLQRCGELDALYNSIKQNGYKKQSEIGSLPVYKQYSQEILVDVGRNGELLFADGLHRLSIAKILDIKIPVVPRVYHAGSVS